MRLSYEEDVKSLFWMIPHNIIVDLVKKTTGDDERAIDKKLKILKQYVAKPAKGVTFNTVGSPSPADTSSKSDTTPTTPTPAQDPTESTPSSNDTPSSSTDISSLSSLPTISADDMKILKILLRERTEQTSTAKNSQPNGTEHMSALTDEEMREELRRRELARQFSAMAPSSSNL